MDRTQNAVGELGVNGVLLITLGAMGYAFRDLISIPWQTLALCAAGGVGVITYTFADFSNRFDKFFESVKFKNASDQKPRLIKTKKFEFGHEYIFTLPAGMNIDHFEKIKLSLEQYLDAKIRIKYKEKRIHITALEVKLSDFYPYELIKCEPMEIVIGMSHEGLIKIKLKSHMLICGATGFGKSTFERGLLVCLICNNKRSRLVLNLCDFKRNELGLLKYSNYVDSFVYDMKGLKELLGRLEAAAIKRYEFFEKYKCLDIEKFNSMIRNNPGLNLKQFPYIVNVIDELAQLEGDKKMMSLFQKRISFDRAAGIIYIICTQRPSVDIIPGSVKANIDTRVCFKTVDSTNSWIVLDDKEAAQYLEIPGRGLIRDIDLKEFQAFYISEDETTELIKHTFKEVSK